MLCLVDASTSSPISHLIILPLCSQESLQKEMNALTTSWNERVHDTREELNAAKASLLEAERKMSALKETLEETVDRKNLLEKTSAEMKKQVEGGRLCGWVEVHSSYCYVAS